MIRTLVVDADEAAATLHVARVRQLAGFDVVGVARSVGEAAELMVRHRPDLVLLDLYLPGASGLDVVALADAAGPRSVDFIVATASQDVSDLRAAMSFGAVHYLVKPFAPEVLSERLRSYAASRARLATRSRLDQAQIDGIFAAARSVGPLDARQRVSGPPRTVHTIEALLAEESAGLTAGEVAERTGLSRATARRCLEQLAQRRRVTIELRYASLGRPQHVYRQTANLPAPSGAGHR